MSILFLDDEWSGSILVNNINQPLDAIIVISVEIQPVNYELGRHIYGVLSGAWSDTQLDVVVTGAKRNWSWAVVNGPTARDGD